MIIEKHPHFKKAYKKRIFYDKKLVHRVEMRLGLFQNNPHHPLLRDHPLKGARYGYRAFWVTADIRILYYPVDDKIIVLYDVGSHNQVY
jgi:addiction module RelE/StbE family toxin